MTDEQIRLVLQITGAKDLDTARAAADQLKVSLEATAAAADRVRGSSGAGGRGLLGASYAFQDFASVITGGGGLARALGAVSNNIDQLATAAGASVANAAKLSFAFTGFVAAIPVLIPLFKSLWESMVGDAEKGPEPVVKALDAAEERLKGIRAELEKLLKATTPEQATTQAGFESLFRAYGKEGGPTGGEMITGGLAQALAASGRGEQFTQAERDIFDPGEEDRAVRVARLNASRSGTPFTEADADRVRAQVGAARVAAQERVNTANVDAAGKIFGAAPTEKGARDTLRAMATQFPGAFPAGLVGHMAEMEPAAIAAQDADEGPGSDAFADRAHKGVEARKKARKEQAAHEERRADIQHRQTEGILRENARKIRAERDVEAALASQMRPDAPPNEAAQRRARHAGFEAQAGELIGQHGVDIVGQAFGPNAAFEASRANPAQIQAMKAQTIRNLEAGQDPMEAVANAFQEVAEAVERHARQSRGFVGRINGVATQTKRSLEQSAMPTGLQR